SVCPDSVRLDEAMIGLCEFLKQMTLCTYGDAIHAMLPSAVLSRFEEFYSVTGKEIPTNPKGLDTQALFIYQYVEKHGRVSLTSLKAHFKATAAEKVRTLCETGYLRRETEVKNAGVGVERRIYSLLATEDILTAALLTKAGIPRSPKQWAIVTALGENGSMSEEDLLKAAKATKAQINGLLAKKLIGLETRTEYRVATAFAKDEKPKTILLNSEQQAAFNTLADLFDSGKPHGALLYGVTGSGKTAVMLSLIDSMLAAGRGVILLLPEIALTPQSLAIFCTRYGERVAVLHSGLSRNERYEAWNKIRSGKAPLVVGTRSAVFAPVKRLGLIIIDEEQEHTYKSDMSPRYHARDIARFRSAANSALMLLCSATPSVESFKKACDGTYTLVRLTHRYGGAALPAVTVADMRAEARGANISPIGTELARRLCEVYARGEQSILFLNRRGYNNFVSCAACGEAVSCPRCSVSMTYHTRGADYGEGELVCHWCGRRMPLPEKCPSCGSEHLLRMGYGTQRVEQELGLLLPDAQIIRMDTDTTSTREAYDRLLGKFRAHEGDILLGTQMVTKGHDFPDVTLVGVLLADMSLYLDDYRAGERTFAMLTQVIGRAGRADKPGEAIIQTNNPEHDIIKLACRQDYDSFYSREIRLRRALTFPPFCDIVLLTVTSPDERAAVMSGKLLADKLHELSGGDFTDVPVIVFGPFPAPVYRVDEKYRVRMVIKCRLNGRSRALFARLRAEFTDKARRGPVLSIDFNPTNI
ncbi:MAG: primosomal protein N', partial [Clostridiales bacterium]|nr:primosomal protein N' [Clostridiales bacterium]